VLSSVFDWARERRWRLLVVQFGQRGHIVVRGGRRFIEYRDRLVRDRLVRDRLVRDRLERDRVDRIVRDELLRVVGLQRVDLERVDIGK
jgi:hypothetical protein